MDLATVNVIGALARSVVQKRGKGGGGALVGERPHTAITRTTLGAASSVHLASRGTERYHLHRVEICSKLGNESLRFATGSSKERELSLEREVLSGPIGCASAALR